MITTLKTYWLKLSDLGIDHHLSPLEQQKIRLLNQFSIAAIGLLLLNGLAFVWTSYIVAICCVLFFCAASLPIFLQSLGNYQAARIAFLLIHCFFSLAMAFVFGEALHIEYIFLMIPVLAIFLLKRQVWIFVLIAIVNYILATQSYLHFEPLVPMNANIELVRFSVFSSTLIFIYWLVQLFTNESVKIRELNQQQLTIISKRNQELERNKSLLEQKNGDLEKAYAISDIQQQNLQLVADYSPAGIAFLNEDLVFQFMNKTYESWYNVRENGMIGLEIQDIWHKRKVKRFKEILPDLKEGKSFQTEFLDEFEGGYKYLNCRLIPEITTAGNLSGIFIFCQDITELKEKEISLTQVNDYLEAEVRERKKTEQKLRVVNKELEHFAHATSHDMKEPLRMIVNYSKFLKKELKEDISERADLYLNYIQDSSNRLSDMVKDLLEYATMDNKLGAGKAINLDKTIILVQNNLRLKIEELNATIKVGKLPTIMGHQTLLIQLFQNIISNGLKFRKPSVTPTIKIDCQAKENNYIFSISDNGIGIDKAHQKSVFRLFNRIKHQQAYEGSGIGLATCKKIVENYGGEIWLKSTKGIGTTFHFTLPKV